MTRIWRIAAVALVLALGIAVWMVHGPALGGSDTMVIEAEPVTLDEDDPERSRVGALEFLAGWELSSDNADFGGISGLALIDGAFLAIGDSGGVFRFRFDEAGAIADTHIGLLATGPEPEGVFVDKSDRDAESLAHDPETGRFWIGFEHANAIWRYDDALAGSDSHSAPEAMAGWPENGGPEALVRLPDGRFLIFSEEGQGPRGSRAVLLFAADPADPDGAPPALLGYRAPGRHSPTDAALLPDGRLVVLNRFFTMTEGVSVIVDIVDLEGMEAGAILAGREIARLDPPLTSDNMEAIAVTEEDGETILWIASDDNFNPLQRTLLLKFRLAE